MSKDLNYFNEFLANPASYPFDDLHRWAKKWGKYLIEHKDEFNYLEDDEWKEVRERLLDALYDTEDQMKAVEAEWEEICEMCDNVEQLDYRERLKFYNRHLQFMKDYPGYFGFTSEDTAEFEKKLRSLEKSQRAVESSELRASVAKIEYENSIAELDDHINKHYEQIGKIPIVTAHRLKKKHDGN